MGVEAEGVKGQIKIKCGTVQTLEKCVPISGWCLWSSGWTYMSWLPEETLPCLTFLSAALSPKYQKAKRGTDATWAAHSHFWKCDFLCLLMSVRLHNARPHPSDDQEAAVKPITWNSRFLIITSTSLFPLVTLSCFSALYLQVSPVHT